MDGIPHMLLSITLTTRECSRSWRYTLARWSTAQQGKDICVSSVLL